MTTTEYGMSATDSGVRHIGTLMDSLARHEIAYDEADPADKLNAAYALICRYRQVQGALRLRKTEPDGGHGTAVTIARLDIHVTELADRIVVQVGTDDRGDDHRLVYLESWDGVSWEREITGHQDTGLWWNSHSNDIGDWCPYSDKPAADTTYDDERCPQGCRGSAVTDTEPG